MERFIGHSCRYGVQLLEDLKSNMDRFIAVTISDYEKYTKLFKIQYG